MPGLSVEISDLSARYVGAPADGPRALESLTLTINAGEQVAVIGPSGAGKTTLLYALACALKPDAGSIRLNGVNPWSLSVRALQRLRGQLFLAPQVPPLPPRQRVITALMAARLPRLSLWGSLRALFYPDARMDAYQALAAFDLAPKLWDRVDRLSGGERQRVALARALLSSAQLWLIDEPLSALDPTRAQMAVDTLIGQAQARGVTLVTTLHQVDVATRYPRVIGLRDGALAFDLPGAHVTQAHLSRLYAQHEYELSAPAATGLTMPAPTPPSVMVCR